MDITNKKFRKNFTGFRTPIFFHNQTKDAYANFIRYNFEEDGEAEIIIKKEVETICPTTFETLDWLLSFRKTIDATTDEESFKISREDTWNVWVYIKENDDFPFERHYFLNIQSVK